MNNRVEIVKAQHPQDCETDSPQVLMKQREFTAMVQTNEMVADKMRHEVGKYQAEAKGTSELCEMYKKKAEHLEKELKLYKNRTSTVDINEILKKSEMSYEQMCAESQKIAQEIYDKKYAPQIKALSEKYGIKL